MGLDTLPTPFLATLSVKESSLLKTIVEANGAVVPRAQLHSQLGAPSARTLDTYIKQIRAKLRSAGLDAARLITHPGQGYSWKS